MKNTLGDACETPGNLGEEGKLTSVQRIRIVRAEERKTSSGEATGSR